MFYEDSIQIPPSNSKQFAYKEESWNLLLLESIPPRYPAENLFSS